MSKSLEDLPWQTLFQMAEQKYESLDYQQAEYFYSLAHKKQPYDQTLVQCYAHLLKTSDKEKEACRVLEQFIRDMPTVSYKIFMELAEIYTGTKSIKTYERGIEEALKCIKNPFKSTAPSQETNRDIAQAYAGIAEVCLTDLINEPQAEAKCKQAMQKGIKIDSTCIDIKLQIANYQMWRDQHEYARKQLLQIYQWIIDQKQQYEQQTITLAGKYLVEVQQYKKSLTLFERLHQNMSSELQIIYMLAFCQFKMGHLIQCEEYLEEYEQMKETGAIISQEIEEAVKEMRNEMGTNKKKGGDGDGEDDEWMDVEDDQDQIQG